MIVYYWTYQLHSQILYKVLRLRITNINKNNFPLSFSNSTFERYYINSARIF